MCNKIEKLRAKSKSDLRHRSHVDDIAEVFPMIHETCTEKYIELNFSEYLLLKRKFEVQDAQFSGKEYSPHCLIAKHVESKYVNHGLILVSE